MSDNSSVILVVLIDGRGLLFTGDAGIPALTHTADYMDACGIRREWIKLIQVPHHGSHQNVGPTILNRLLGPIQPLDIPTKVAYVSAAPDGEPEHPVTEGRQRLPPTRSGGLRDAGRAHAAWTRRPAARRLLQRDADALLFHGRPLMTAWLMDAYTFRARLVHAFLASLPAALAALPWAPDILTTVKAMGAGTLVAVLMTAIMVQVGRHAGRRLQHELFAEWGGSPTTRLLRHRETTNSTLLHRRHAQVAMLTGLQLPSAAEEEQDPAKADEIYETCIAIFREKTRDTRRFGHLFSENCDYGFRRNLWGLKSFGISLAAAVVVGAGVYIAVVMRTSGRVPTPAVVAAAGSAVVVTAWLSYVKKDWVRAVADAYAERLLATLEAFSGDDAGAIPTRAGGGARSRGRAR